ncbi:MAG: glutaredoxin family protein [Gammaproteobacteria bacterium]
MVKPLNTVVLILLMALFAGAHARSVVECVDGDGNVSFRDSCPPGMTKKGEKRLRGVGGSDADGPDLADIAAAHPVTVYVVPQCDACDLVRNALSSRDIPHTVKDVQDDAAAQEELKGRSGGLTVPTTLVGERVLTGYSRDAIDGALRQAGYPVAPAATPSPTDDVPADVPGGDAG